MVARRDLGMDISSEKVFIAQKWMIDRANVAGKPIITAYQMLDSMFHKTRPTRAETSDVANAVLDGSDVVVCSRETSHGKYPFQTVFHMAKICAEAERCFNYKQRFEHVVQYTPLPVGTTEAVAQSACGTVHNMNIDLIVAITDTGNICRLLAKYKPSVPIFACCVSNNVIRSLQLVWGVTGYKIPSYQGTENLLRLVIEQAKALKIVSKGHKAVCIHSSSEETPDESNIMKIIEIT
jgi:pyruvate kinase